MSTKWHQRMSTLPSCLPGVVAQGRWIFWLSSISCLGIFHETAYSGCFYSEQFLLFKFFSFFFKVLWSSNLLQSLFFFNILTENNNLKSTNMVFFPSVFQKLQQPLELSSSTSIAPGQTTQGTEAHSHLSTHLPPSPSYLQRVVLMGALKEWNLMQFIKGAGCESFLCQNPIKFMIFIACGSPLVYVTLIRPLVSKSDKTRKYFLMYSGQRHLGVKSVCCSWWPQGHTYTSGFLPWFCFISLWFCCIHSRKTNSTTVWSLTLPGKEAPSQNHSPSTFQHAWTQKFDNLLQSVLQTGPYWIPNPATLYSWSRLNKGTPGITLPQVSNASLVQIRPLKRPKQFVWCRGTKKPQKRIKTRAKLEIKSNNTPFGKPQSECMISG